MAGQRPLRYLPPNPDADYLVPQQRIPGYLPYPNPVAPGNIAVPNASGVDWPQAQFAPPWLAPGSASFSPYVYPMYSEDTPVEGGYFEMDGDLGDLGEYGDRAARVARRAGRREGRQGRRAARKERRGSGKPCRQARRAYKRHSRALGGGKGGEATEGFHNLPSTIELVGTMNRACKNPDYGEAMGAEWAEEWRPVGMFLAGLAVGYLAFSPNSPMKD